MHEAKDVVVGIDVAKAALDVAVRPQGEERHLANDAAGIAEIVGWLQALKPQVIVVEATGGYEAALVAELGIVSLPVAVVNPRQVRDFARATGRLAKTDRLDAQALAHFGQAVHPTPTPRPLPDEQAQALAALVERRRQVVAMRTAEENRLGAARVAAVRARIQAHLAWLEADLGDIDGDLRQQLRAGQPPLARAGRPVAERSRHRPDPLADPLGRVTGIGAALPRTDRRAGWGCTPQPGQRYSARPARGLGRAQGGAHGALHGHLARHALQSPYPRVLRTPPGSGQSQEGGVGSMHAQTTHHSQRDAQAPDSLAGSGRLSLPAADTCCHSCSFVILGTRCAGMLGKKPSHMPAGGAAMTRVRPPAPTVAFVDE
jgi:Transposase